MGALVGGRIVWVRYCCGRVLVKIQDLLLDEGFSTFWAAAMFIHISLSLFSWKCCIVW